MGREPYKFDPADARRFAREQGIEAYQRGDQLHLKVCPYCHGNRDKDKKTFAIDLKTGQFNCLRASCGARGNMIVLAKDFNFSLGDQTADEYIHGWKRFKSFQPAEKPEPKDEAVEYLESRGISKKIAEEYNITISKTDDSVLVFPFYDEGDVLTFIKYRKTDFEKGKNKNKEWCEAGCKPILFGMNHCNFDNKTLILTEGQLDSLSVAEAGIENAVSVPNGAKGFTWIPYCWDFLAKFDTLIVFGDYEDGSISLLSEMRSRFHGCTKHVRPEDYRDCKDANDILRKYGTEAIWKAVSNAEPIKNPKVKGLEEVTRVEMSQLECFSTGFKSLDKLIGGFYFGQLILLTGERGEGKSTLASQFGTFALKAGYSTFFYSGELLDWYFKAWFEYQAAGPVCINKLVSTIGNVSYSVMGEVLPMLERWYTGRAYIYDNGIVNEDEEQETLLETMENVIRQYGCRVLFVDNLMSAIMDDLNVDLYRSQTIFVKELARMAKAYNVLIFLIAHPRKATGKEFDNDSISGSGNITNLVDITMRYSRPDDDKNSDRRKLTILKNRLTGRIDKKGLELYYDESSKRISESQTNFDWDLGWEDSIDLMSVPDDVEVPFK